jgi:TM2 domain-containing membrane protein YozV
MYEDQSHGGSKTLWMAYVFWAFLGALGAHRFYLGYDKSAVAILVLFIVGVTMTPDHIVGMATLAIGATWLLIDTFLIPVMMKRNRLPTETDTQWGRQS